MEDSTAALVEYKLPAAELRKLAESHVYLNLDCNQDSFLKCVSHHSFLVDRPNPEGAVQMSSALSHSAPQLQVDPLTGLVSMPCSKGYCCSKASHGVESGSWYFEVKIVRGWVRVGWAQTLAEIQGPVGYDEYSYGISNRHSAIFHCSRSVKSLKSFSDAKVIGCVLRLPESEAEFSDFASAEVQERVHRQFPPLNFNTSYRIRQDLLAKAKIEFYIDGELADIHFEPIYRAKYYPAVSVFGDAIVQVSFDNFVHPLPPDCKPFNKAGEV